MNFDIDYIYFARKYLMDIEKGKQDRKVYTLIDTGKECFENFSANLVPKFNGFEYPYVNLENKYMSLITGLDTTNSLIKEVTDIWKKILNKENFNEVLIYNTYFYSRIFKLSEYIIFDLKHFIDETIATLWIIDNHPQDDRIPIHDIGTYLKEDNTDFKILDNFINFFGIMNDLFNAYKHSYLNTEFKVLGKEEPCFIALGSRTRCLSTTVTPYIVPIKNIINEFNEFYKESFALIDTLTKV